MNRLPASLAILLAIPCVSRAAEAVPVSLESGGVQIRGRFFAAEGEEPGRAILLIPGWPGNPNDVLGLGSLLSDRGIHVLMVNPRGMHDSEGTASFAHTLDDVGRAYEWLLAAPGVDPDRVAVGGHSFGGGVVLAWAAREPRATRVVSIAGTDHGELVRHRQIDAFFDASLLEALRSSAAPEGPVRFDIEASLEELERGIAIYGLRENAPRLANRRLLLIGGWEDRSTTVDEYLLPLYRALRGAGAEDVTFRVYHDDHSFAKSREQIADEIASWSAWSPGP